MTERDPTRRRYLGSLGAVCLAGAAGCQVFGFGGESLPEDPLFAGWLPADGGPWFRKIEYVDVDAVDRVSDSLADSTHRRLTGGTASFDRLGVDRENVEETLGLRLANDWYDVAAGGFDVGSASDHVEQFDFDEQDDDGSFVVYQGVDRYSGGDESSPREDVGISPGYVVKTPHYTDAPSFEDVLATARGDRERLRASDDDVRKLLSVVDNSTHLELQTYDDHSRGGVSLGWDYEPDPAVGFVESYSIGSERTDLTLAFVYDDAANLDVGDFRAFLDRERVVAAYEEVSISTDGRLVVVEASIPTSRFNFLEQKSPSNLDDIVSLDFDYRLRSEEMAIRITSYSLSGGHPLAERVIVRVDGERTAVIDDIEGSDPVSNRVTPGDEVVVVAVDREGDRRVVSRYFV